MLIVLALPVRYLHLGQTDNGALPKSTQSRQSYDAMTEGFGSGSNGPMLVAVSLSKPAHNDQADLNRLRNQEQKSTQQEISKQQAKAAKKIQQQTEQAQQEAKQKIEAEANQKQEEAQQQIEAEAKQQQEQASQQIQEQADQAKQNVGPRGQAAIDQAAQQEIDKQNQAIQQQAQQEIDKQNQSIQKQADQKQAQENKTIEKKVKQQAAQQEKSSGEDDKEKFLESKASDPRLTDLRNDIKKTKGVDEVTYPLVNKKRDAAVYTVTATTAPSSRATEDLVNTLRSDVLPKATKGKQMSADVGGTTASYIDLAAEITSKLPLVIAIVLIPFSCCFCSRSVRFWSPSRRWP